MQEFLITIEEKLFNEDNNKENFDIIRNLEGYI